MSSPDKSSFMIKELLKRLAGSPDCDEIVSRKADKNGTNGKNNKFCVSPSQALVIAGILGGVLEVDSVLVDRDQVIQIVLEGSLKEKTELEKMMDQIGSMPFDEVMKAVIDRL